MNRERLQRLIEVLDEVEKTNRIFDMSTWYEERDCGTAACAAGWYAKLAPNQGLVISAYAFMDDVDYCIALAEPKPDVQTVTEILMDHFDLNRSEVQYIFFPGTYLSEHSNEYEEILISPGAVKEHIQYLLRGDTILPGLPSLPGPG